MLQTPIRQDHQDVCLKAKVLRLMISTELPLLPPTGSTGTSRSNRLFSSFSGLSVCDAFARCFQSSAGGASLGCTMASDVRPRRLLVWAVLRVVFLHDEARAGG